MENLSILSVSARPDVPPPPTSGFLHDVLRKYYAVDVGVGYREGFVEEALDLLHERDLSVQELIADVRAHLAALHVQLCAVVHEQQDKRGAVDTCIPGVGPSYNVACLHGGIDFPFIAVELFRRKKLIGFMTSRLWKLHLLNLNSYANPVLDHCARALWNKSKNPLSDNRFRAGHQWYAQSVLRASQDISQVQPSYSIVARSRMFSQAARACLQSRPVDSPSTRDQRKAIL